MDVSALHWGSCPGGVWGGLGDGVWGRGGAGPGGAWGRGYRAAALGVGRRSTSAAWRCGRGVRALGRAALVRGSCLWALILCSRDMASRGLGGNQGKAPSG